MDPVDGVSSLVRLLQGRVSENRRTAKSSGTEGSRRTSPPKVSLAELESELKLKLKRLGADTSNPEQRARVVVESVLVWEFGDKVRNEPKFNLLIAKVHQHLNSDNRIKDAFSSFLERLSA